MVVLLFLRLVCFGCDEPSWNKSLLAWNAQRVEPEGPDLEMSVCGDCLYRYKYVKDFCPACFKPYATDDSMLPLLGPVVVVPDGAHAAGADTAVKGEAGAEAETGEKKAGDETEAVVVMCGECVEPALATAVADSEAMDVEGEGEGEAGDNSVVDTDKEEATTITSSTNNLPVASDEAEVAADTQPPATDNATANGSNSSSASATAAVGNKSATNSDELSEDNMVSDLLFLIILVDKS